jgi:hypothetical protein
MGVISSSRLKSISSPSEILPSADYEGGTGIVMPFAVPVDIYISICTPRMCIYRYIYSVTGSGKREAPPSSRETFHADGFPSLSSQIAASLLVSHLSQSPSLLVSEVLGSTNISQRLRALCLCFCVLTCSYVSHYDPPSLLHHNPWPASVLRPATSGVC